MRIDTAYLKANPEAEIWGSLDGLTHEMEVGGERLEFTRPVTGNVVIRSGEEGIWLEGELEAILRLRCARCLKDFDYPIHTTFEVNLIFDGPGRDQGEAYVIENDELDLEPIIAEQIMFALPLSPLCREDCKGLCPRCGADLNQGECGCRDDNTDPRWDALKKLMEGKEG